MAGKGGQDVGSTTFPPSRAEFSEILGPQTSGALRTCPGLYRDYFTPINIA